MAYPTDNGNTYTTHVIGDTIAPEHVNNLQTEVTAIKTLLGIVGSVTNGTFYYVNSEITGADKAVGKTATQTLTNKTLTSPSITTPTITTPTINLGSDATGDIFYRNSGGTLARLAIGTNNKILRVVAGLPAWDTETALVNADATTKGVVELATASEITAGTATGGTGASLYVSPDQLALSTPVFSGLGLTNTTRLTRLAGYSPAGNTTENDVWTTTIGANLLGANGIIKTKTYFQTTATATAETYTIKLYYGGSAILTITHTVNAIGGGNASTWSGVIEGWIINNGATNSQNVSFISIGSIQWSNSSNLTPNYPSAPADTTSAIDTTSSQTLKMTVQRSNGSGASGAFSQTIVETIKNV